MVNTKSYILHIWTQSSIKNLCCPRHIYQNNFVLNSIKQKICDRYNLCITFIVNLRGNASYNYDFFFLHQWNNKVAINNFGLFTLSYQMCRRSQQNACGVEQTVLRYSTCLFSSQCKHFLSKAPSPLRFIPICFPWPQLVLLGMVSPFKLSEGSCNRLSPNSVSWNNKHLSHGFLGTWRPLSWWFWLRCLRTFGWSCSPLRVWLGLASRLIHMTLIWRPLFLSLWAFRRAA